MTHEIVYRIVNSKRRGMYRATDDEDSLWERAIGIYDERFQPPPECDGLPLFVTPEHRFGFKNITQIKRWTMKRANRKKLEEHGGMLNIYRVPSRKVVHGRNQLMFLAKSARLVKTMKITEFCGD